VNENAMYSAVRKSPLRDDVGYFENSW